MPKLPDIFRGRESRIRDSSRPTIESARLPTLELDHPYLQEECIQIFKTIVFPSLKLDYSEEALKRLYPEIANANPSTQRFIFYSNRRQSDSTEILWIRVVDKNPRNASIGASICIGIDYDFTAVAHDHIEHTAPVDLKKITG